MYFSLNVELFVLISIEYEVYIITCGRI